MDSMEPWQWAKKFNNVSRYNHITTNLVEAINFVTKRTRHQSIFVVFSVTFYRITTLMLRMDLEQLKQMNARHVLVEEVQKAMDVNA